MRLLLITTVLCVGFGVGACKRQADNNVAEPGMQGQVNGTGGTMGVVEGTAGLGGAAAAGGEALHHDEAPHANVAGANGEAVNAAGGTGGGAVAAVDDPSPFTPEETATYNKACQNLLKRMAACAKDPGFLKYQSRWTSKGAPKAGAPSFEKRISSWGSGGERTTSCKSWSTRPGTRSHFVGSKARLTTLTEDVKLSCEMFGQELDDDGWFPAALTDT